MTHEQVERVAREDEARGRIEDRNERTNRWFKKLAVALAVYVALGVTAAVGYDWHDQHARSKLAKENAATLVDEDRTVGLILCVLDPANKDAKGCGPFIAQQKALGLSTQHLVGCLANRIDVDTGHAQPDAACAALLGVTRP